MSKLNGTGARPSAPPWGAMLVLVALGTAVFVNAQDGRIDTASREGSSPYSIGLWGDLPYSPTQATVGVPNLIADMNAQKLAFTAGWLQELPARAA